MNDSLVKNWDSYLLSFPEEFYDTYFEEKYVKLYETENTEAVCYVCSENGKILLFPFLQRTFYHNGTRFYDFETAYGYGGPICNVKDDNFIVSALKAFKTYCISNNFIAGFIRFHPLLKNNTGFSSIGQLLLDRHTIAIDLTLPIEEIWLKELEAKARNRINKANNIKLEFIVDREFKYLNDFIRIYNSTMMKV
jgi:serine/alanine adding enzyme